MSRLLAKKKDILKVCKACDSPIPKDQEKFIQTIKYTAQGNDGKPKEYSMKVCGFCAIIFNETLKMRGESLESVRLPELDKSDEKESNR